MDFSKWPPLKFWKFLDDHIFGTYALIKAKLVSKHMFLWSSNPIIMFVKTYKDFWMTKSRMATLYNWIRQQKIFSNHSYSSLMMTCMIFWKRSNFHPLAKHQSSGNMLFEILPIYMGAWNILVVGIAEIYSLNSCHQKDTNTLLVSMFKEHSGNWNIAADTSCYWYRVYPVCVNGNPVPQKMYRNEVIVIQKFLNDSNNLNTCQVVTFKYPIQDW